jgi:hypothetical protein
VLVPASVVTALGSNALAGQPVAAYLFPQVAPETNRSGTVAISAGHFMLGNTDSDLDQTAIHAPSVFNYYLPDYRHSGSLAAAGVTTPEFQRTNETSIVAQANFLYQAIAKLDTDTGLAAHPVGIGLLRNSGQVYFSSLYGALVVDFSDWLGLGTDLGLGAAPYPALHWTENANLPTLIEHWMTLLGTRVGLDSGRSDEALNVDGESVSDLILKHLMQPMLSISGSSGVSECTITTDKPHGLQAGESVTISGVTGSGFSPSINGTFSVVAAPTSTTFTIAVEKTSTAAPTLTAAHLSSIPYTDAASTEAQRDARLRALLHLLITSPDFAIQR